MAVNQGQQYLSVIWGKFENSLFNVDTDKDLLTPLENPLFNVKKVENQALKTTAFRISTAWHI